MPCTIVSSPAKSFRVSLADAGSVRAPLRVLLVEDDAADAKLLRETLARAATAPHTFVQVDRIASALAALRDEPFDVVLLDLTLPDARDLSGLRSLVAAAPATPVVVLSGVSTETMALDAMQSGAQDYLVKGEAAPPLIVRSIRYAIERSRAEVAQRELLRAHISAATAQAERARLLLLVSQAPTAICVLTGPNLVYELANDRYLQLVAKTNVIGKPLFEGMPELVGQGLDVLMRTVMRTGEPFHGDEVRVRLDREGTGELRDAYMDLVYQPMRAANGVVESVMVVATEVTERVTGRERVEAARRAATLSEQRFQLLAEAIPQIVWSIHPDGHDVYLSPRWQEYTGQDPALALAEQWRSAVHPDDYERCFTSWAAAAQTRSLWQIEYRLRRADGEYRWHLGRAVPHCDEANVILRWYGTATDIDEQRRAIRSRDEVLATVSHDLRGPLNAIAMAAEVIGSAPAQARPVAAIRRASEQMTRLIQDLLDMASIESGHLAIEPTARRVGTIVDEALDAVRRVACAKDVEVRGDDRADDATVLCDPDRMLQVLANILGNALKFTPAGGRITVVTERVEERFVRFAIADTGPGIATSELALVFDRFWQAKATARAGTGLGLAICKGIVEQHGGAIGVESQPGHGTTFWFTLPRVADP